MVDEKMNEYGVEYLNGVDGIIFDVDGTLWDVTDVCAKAWSAAVREHSDYDASFTGAQLKCLFGKTMDVIINTLFPDITEELKTELTAYCYQYEDEYILKEEGLESYPMVAQTFAALSKKYPLYIVSNCQKGYIDMFLQKTGTAEYIKGFLCFGDTLRSKGYTLTKLCKDYGIKKPIYVGDTRGDEEACIEAGMPIIYASYGFGKVEHPLATIKGFDDLLKLF